MEKLNIWKYKDVVDCLENEVNHAINLYRLDKAKQ